MITVEPTGYGAFNASASFLVPDTTPKPGQLSDAKGVGTGTSAEHDPIVLFTLMIGCATVMTGSSASATFTTCVTGVAGLPFASMIFQVITVIPTGYGSVNAWLSSRVPIGVPITQLSVTVGTGTSTTAEHNPKVLLTLIGFTAAITGTWLSVTTTVCVIGKAALPLISVTVQVIVVVPTG